MRICKIYGGLYPWEVRVEKVSRTLLGAGHEVHLLCRGDRRSAASERIDGLEVHRCTEMRGPRALGGLSTLPFPLNPRWTSELSRIVRDRSIDLLLLRDIPLGLNALRVARRASIPVVLDMAENYPAMLRDLLRWSDHKAVALVTKNPWIAAATERRVVRACDHVLVVVEESRDRLVRMGVDPGRISIVSNTPGAPTADEPPPERTHRPDPDALRLVYVGGLQAGRGIETLLQAVSQYRRRSRVHLSIVGEGPTRPKLEAEAGRLGLEQDVTFVGWVDPGGISRYIRESDVGVVPHLVSDHTNTTIPNKLFDYMACARPALVSAAAPMRRIVREEQCGLDYRSDDPGDLASKLVTLEDGHLRARLGGHGRRAVAERYNWERDAARLVAAVGGVGAATTPVPQATRC